MRAMGSEFEFWNMVQATVGGHRGEEVSSALGLPCRTGWNERGGRGEERGRKDAY